MIIQGESRGVSESIFDVDQLRNLIDHQKRFIEYKEKSWSKKGTWILRKSVSKYLSVIWFFLLGYTILLLILPHHTIINLGSPTLFPGQKR